MSGQDHAGRDLLPVGWPVTPQKLRQFQKLIVIGKTRLPRYRAPGAGRYIGEVGRRSGNRAAAEIQTEPESAEQVPLPRDIVSRPDNSRIERLKQPFEGRKYLGIRF